MVFSAGIFDHLNGDFEKPRNSVAGCVSSVFNSHYNVPDHLRGKLKGMLHIEGRVRASGLKQMDTSPATHRRRAVLLNG